jgi:FKBP-type peptidyl-prolyl cis-trans isomerase FkpA
MKRYALIVAAFVGVVASCNDNVAGLEPASDPATETFAPSLGVNISQMTRTGEGVYYRDLSTGMGLEFTTSADSIDLSYAGFLKDGTLFESATNRRFKAFDLNSLIPGFRIGMLGMKEGGARKIVVPSELGYGGQSRRDPRTLEIIIPRQSTLIFDITLIRVFNPAPAPPTTP